MDITGMLAVLGTFTLPFAIVWTIVRGPKAKAKAEIMKAEALTRLEDKRGLISAVKTEELAMTVNDQETRIASLEEEVRFLKSLLDKKIT
jgi:hypothetical protein